MMSMYVDEPDVGYHEGMTWFSGLIGYFIVSFIVQIGLTIYDWDNRGHDVPSYMMSLGWFPVAMLWIVVAIPLGLMMLAELMGKGIRWIGMRQHQSYRRLENGDLSITDVDFEDVIAGAVDDLVGEGMDEDAHFRGDWDDLDAEDEDELEKVVNDEERFDRVMVSLKPLLIERLREVLSDRRRERKE